MPKRPEPILDEATLTPKQIAQQRNRIRVRSSRIRRAAGEPLSPKGRVQNRPFTDALYTVVSYDARRAVEREACARNRALSRALPGIVRGLRRVHDLLLAPPAPARASRALEQRRRRLLALAPTGIDAATWREIVDFAACRCLAPGCARPACRVARLADGTPYPACPQHGTELASQKCL